MQTREELRRLSDAALCRAVFADKTATVREKELSYRVERLVQALDEIEEFVETHPAFFLGEFVFGKPH